jgi:hypothetical protein
MPKEIQLTNHGGYHQTRKYIIAAASVLLLIVITLGLIFGRKWFADITSGISPSSTRIEQQTPQANTIITSTEKDLCVKHVTSSPTELLPTQTPSSPTPTQEETVLALEIPIGVTHQFIIHRVAQWESLQNFTDQYNTTVDAIRAVNYDLIAPLWVDWIVIIPVNIIDASELPSFEAYQVTDDSVTLITVSEQLSVSLEDIMLFNNIHSDRNLQIGEWLLIPRE